MIVEKKNYINLINNAWELREQGILSVYEHDLYCYLVHKCNRLNWKNPFNQPTNVVCAVLGITRNALISRRSKLQKLGLITYKKGRRVVRAAEYTLIIDIMPSEDAVLVPASNRTTAESFRKPEIAEIIDYCKDRDNHIDAQRFFDFYESKDWMIGKNRMKDWKAAIRTWENKDKENRSSLLNHDNTKKYVQF